MCQEWIWINYADSLVVFCYLIRLTNEITALSFAGSLLQTPRPIILLWDAHLLPTPPHMEGPILGGDGDFWAPAAELSADTEPLIWSHNWWAVNSTEHPWHAPAKTGSQQKSWFPRADLLPGVACPPAAWNRLLISTNIIWENSEKIQFSMWGFFLMSVYQNTPSHQVFCLSCHVVWKAQLKGGGCTWARL